MNECIELNLEEASSSTEHLWGLRVLEALSGFLEILSLIYHQQLCIATLVMNA